MDALARLTAEAERLERERDAYGDQLARFSELVTDEGFIAEPAAWVAVAFQAAEVLHHHGYTPWGRTHAAEAQAVELAKEVARLREDNQRLEDQTVRQARELTAIRDASRGIW